jgi:TATA-binding protein-associated factor Taf7
MSDIAYAEHKTVALRARIFQDSACLVLLYTILELLDFVSLIQSSCSLSQMIMVREPEEAAPEGHEFKHGLTPPMRDACRRRFRREPDLNVSSILILEDNMGD